MNTSHNPKVYCRCPRCEEARQLLKRDQPKRQVPKQVMEAWKEKQAKQEELELFKGNIKMCCPSCKHWTYWKVGPRMQCPACGLVVK